MAKYLYRTCPKCGDYVGVVIPQPPGPVDEIPIDATCLRCGYRLELRILKSSPGEGCSLLLGDEVKSLIDNPIGRD